MKITEKHVEKIYQELLRMISFAYGAFAIYEEIGNKASIINKVGFGRNFLGWTQSVMLEKICLEICKLYSKNKSDCSLYKLVKSLPAIKCVGKSIAQIRREHPKYTIDFTDGEESNNQSEILFSKHLLGKIDGMRNGQHFQKIHIIRCKRIAHLDLQGENIKAGPPLQEIKELIDFSNSILTICVDLIWGNIAFLSDSFSGALKAGASNVVKALEYYSKHWDEAFQEEFRVGSKS